MFDFTEVGHNIELDVPKSGTSIVVHFMGTYEMVIALQRRDRVKRQWHTVRTWDVEDVMVNEIYVTELNNEKLRLIVLVDDGGTAKASLLPALNEMDVPTGVRIPWKSGTLTLLINWGSKKIWAFESTDNSSTVDAAGYFEGLANHIGVGDMVFGVVLPTAATSGTYICRVSNPATGQVDLSDISLMGPSNTRAYT